HIRYKIVQIHPLPGRVAFFYHAPEGPNHIAGSASIRHDISEQVAKFANVAIAAINKALSRASVGNDSRERLIEFMGNGCRQFTQHCHSAEMAELCLVLQRFRFSELASRDVHDRGQNEHAIRGLNRIYSDLEWKFTAIFSP